MTAGLLVSVLLGSFGFLPPPRVAAAQDSTPEQWIPSDINNVQISPSVNASGRALCWSADSATDQAWVRLQECNRSQPRQRFNVTREHNVRLNSDTSLCLNQVDNSPDVGLLRLTFDCGSSQSAQFRYQTRHDSKVPIGAFYHFPNDYCANLNDLGVNLNARLRTRPCGEVPSADRWSIGTADLAVTPGSDRTARRGDTVTVDLNIRNGGPQTAYVNRFAITATDGFTMTSTTRLQAAGDNYEPCTISGSSATCATKNAQWPAASTGTVQVTGTVPADATPGTVYEICGTQSSDVTNEGFIGDNTGCATVTVPTPRADLAVTTAGAQTATTTVDSGQTGVQIPFTFTNNGPDAADRPTATYTVPAGFTVTNVSPPPGWNCDTTARICTFRSSFIGGVSHFTMTGTVAGGQTAGSAIGDVTMTAAVTGQQTDPNPANNTATRTLQVSGDLNVNVSKTVPSDGPVEPGDRVTFEVAVSNDGANRVEGATVTDEVPSSLTNVTWNCRRTGNASCAIAGSGNKSLNDTVSISPGARVTYTITGTVATSASGTTITNTATVAMPPGATNSGTSSSAASVTVRAISDLAWRDAPYSVTVAPGESGTLAVRPSNTGPSATSEAFTFTLTPPTGITFPEADLPDGCVRNDDGTVTCTRAARLAVNSAPSYQIPFAVSPSAAAGTTLTGSGSIAYDLDPNTDNNSTDLQFHIGQVSNDFAITRTSSAAVVAPGRTNTMNVTVANHGPSTSTTATTVTFDAAANSTFSASGLSDGCSLASSTRVTCSIPAGVAPGQTREFALTYTVDPTAAPNATHSGGSVTVANENDGVSSNNSRSWGYETGARLADMSLAKAGPAEVVTPGSTFDYTLTVDNAGPSVATGPVTVTDTLPAQLAYVSQRGAESCETSDQEVTCTIRGDYPVGKASPITLTVRLDQEYTGDGSDLPNSATVASTSGDPDPVNNSASVSGIGVDDPSATLTLDKSPATSDPIRPGDSFTFHLQVGNQGPSVAREVTVVDTLPDALAFVSSADGCTGTEGEFGGTVTCPTRESLAADGSVTNAVTVRLDPSYDGTGADAAVTNTATADADDAEPVSDSAGLPGGAVAEAEADVTGDKQLVTTEAVAPGQTFDYTISVGNSGPSTATGIAVSDTLPAGLTFDSSPDCDASGQEVTCATIDALTPGGTGSYTMTVRVNPDYAGDGTGLVNTATAEAETADPDPSNNTSSAEPPEIAAASADLAIKKDIPTTDPVTPGETFEYKLTVANHGPSDASNLDVTDTLPAAVAFASSDDCAGTAGEFGGTVTCPTRNSLAEGGTASYLITVRLDPAYTGDGSDIVNTATVEAETADPDDQNNTNSLTGLPALAEGQADLTVEKSVGGAPEIVPGDEFTYTIALTNNGPSSAVGPAVTDTLGEGMSFAGYPEGCVVEGQVLSCDRTALGMTSLPNESTTSIQLTVRVDSDYTGDGTDLTNTAEVSSETNDPNPDNNTATATGGVTVGEPAADLQLDKRLVTTDEVAPGETIDYTLTVTNHGPSDAADATITDTLPDGLSWLGSGPDACTVSEQTVTCERTEVLKPEASASFALRAAIDPAYDGTAEGLCNTAEVATSTTDPNPANDTAQACPNLAASRADLSMVKQLASENAVAPGETFAYTLDVANDGPSAASGATITDSLDENLTFVSVDDETCTAPDQTVTCGPFDLAAGDARQITITVRLAEDYPGDGSDVGNTATVEADTADPDDTNNSSTVSGIDVADASADVSVTKTVGADQVSPGEEFDYTIEVANAGPSTAVEVAATDTLPAELAFVSSTDCDADEQEVTCAPVSSLAVGDSIVYTITVELDPAYTGDGSDVVNTVTVEAETADPDDSNNTATETVPVGAANADLSLVKAPTTDVAISPGETFAYELTVTNYGPSVAVNVEVEDTLPGALAFVSSQTCTGDEGVYGGVIGCEPVETLAVGASATFTIELRLDPAYTGDGSDVVNTAVAGSETADPDDSDNTARAGIPGGSAEPPKADLAIEKTSSETGTAGGNGTFTLVVSNQGPSQASNTVVTDELPASLSLTGSSPVQCAQVGRKVTCELGTLAVDETVEIVLDVDIASSAPDGEVLTNTATVAADAEEVDDSDNSDSAEIVVTAEASVSISDTPPESLAAGAEATYVVAVVNDGPSEARDVVVTYELDPNFTFVSDPEGLCTPDGQTVTCELGTVAAGTDAELPLTVAVAVDAAEGTRPVNTGEVATGTTNTSDSTSSESTGPPIQVSADLAITKVPADDSTAVRPGEQFDYQVVVTNNGPADAAGVTVTDTLPGTLRFVAADGDTLSDGVRLVATDGDCAADGDGFGAVLTCGPVESLAVGGELVYTITVQLDPAYTGDGADVQNLVRVTAETNDPDEENNDASAGLPSEAAGEASADLAIAKQLADPAPVTPGEQFSYVLDVVNNGPSAAVDPIVTDTLPESLTFVGEPHERWSCGAEEQAVTCAFQGSYAPGSTDTVEVSVRLDPAYTGNGSDLVNSAAITSSTADPDESNNTASAEPVTAGEPQADVGISKHLGSPAGQGAVVPGGTVEMTLSVGNQGPSTATGVRVTDVLPPELALVSADDEACTASDQTITCGPIGVLEPGTNVDYQLVLRLSPDYTGDGSDIVNTATVEAETADPEEANNSSTVSGIDVAAASADVSITKAVTTEAPVSPGEAVTFETTVANAGPSTAVEVAVTDTLPAELAFVSSADCVADGQKVTCGPVDSLAVGDEVVYTITVRLDPDYTGDGSDIVNTATVEAETADPDEANNSATATLEGLLGEPAADVSITKKVSTQGPVSPGESVTFEMTVANAGPSRATDVVVSDRLPARLALRSSSTCSGRTGVFGGTVNCGPRGTLAPGGTVTFVVTATVHPSYRGDGSDIKNTATVSGSSKDPDESNNTATVTLAGAVGDAVSDLKISKRFADPNAGPIAPGKTFAYQLVAANRGPASATGVVVTDELPHMLGYVGASGAICSDRRGSVTCRVAGALAPDDRVEIALTVRLAADYRGDGSDIVNIASVSSDNSGGTSTSDPVIGVPGGISEKRKTDLPITGALMTTLLGLGLTLLATGVIIVAAYRTRRTV